MLAFAPPDEVFDALADFMESARWADATVDPYVLVDVTLLSWYHCIDNLAWGVTTLVRTEEQEVFDRTRLLWSNESSSIGNVALHRLHTSAKNALFMLEALDAAVRLAETAISAHEPLRQRGGIVSENTHLHLRHRLELFHSTRLRMLSCQARIKNTVDLAFHINTAYDSRLNIKNSRSMRAISIVGLVFIPFGTITSIFGTQFFTPAANGRHMSVNPDVWILFVIAIPITLISLAIWVASERNDKYNHGQSYTHDQNHGHGHKQHHNFNLSLGLSLSNTYNYIPRLLELLSQQSWGFFLQAKFYDAEQ
ncbi:hypothetical protein VTH82DRAFT_3333 [Thermothelomyces myriococcoides]